ncbi:MAG TPA: MMPL family transporter [Candidatus Omnitrophota bacterium]|nr:MMPL family transporter [Candidatus Omnitrophota bacterium]
MSRRFNFVHSQARLINRYAFGILTALLFITIFLFPAAAKLKIKANFLSLLPASSQSVKSTEKLIDKIGGTSYIIVAVESEDEESAKLAAEKLASAAKSFEQVESADNRSSIPEYAKRHMLFFSLDSLKKFEKEIQSFIDYQRRKNSPFSLDLIQEDEPKVNADALDFEEKVYSIGAFPKNESGTVMRIVLIKPHFQVGDFVPSKRLFDRIDMAFADIARAMPKPVTHGITGPYKTRYDEYFTITQDLKLTTAVTVFLIAVCLFLGFRTLRSWALGFIPLAVGMVWMCAFATFAVGYLNLISGFLLGIMTGMGIDYSLHMLVELEEERSKTKSTFKAVERTIRSLAMPLFTTVLTTIIAFFTLTLSGFEGYRHFGLIAGVGLVLCAGTIFYGLPSLLVAGEKLKLFRWKASPPRKHLREPRRGPVFALVGAGVIFSIICLFQLPRVQFEFNFTKLQERDAPAMDLAQRIGDHFGVVLNPVAILTPHRERAGEISDRIKAHVASSPQSHIDFSASLMTQVPRQQEEKIAVLVSIREKLDRYARLIQSLDKDARKKIADLREQLEPEILTLDRLPVSVTEQYEGKTGELSAVFVYPNQSIMDGRFAQKFVKEIQSLNLPADAELAGEPMIYVEILSMLERDTPRAVALSLLVIIVLLFVHFRNLGDVMWVLLPVLTGFLWMCGTAAMLGVHFNYMNMAILPCVLGVGIDSGVYIFHRYKKEKKSTMAQILDKTGKAVILSSMTTMSAFGSLFLAKHQGMSSMGALGFIGFGCCMLASVAFVPALMETLAMKYWRPFGHEAKKT